MFQYVTQTFYLMTYNRQYNVIYLMRTIQSSPSSSYYVCCTQIPWGWHLAAGTKQSGTWMSPWKVGGAVPVWLMSCCGRFPVHWGTSVSASHKCLEEEILKNFDVTLYILHKYKAYPENWWNFQLSTDPQRKTYNWNKVKARKLMVLPDVWKGNRIKLQNNNFIDALETTGVNLLLFIKSECMIFMYLAHK